jgi:hypothetical protein
MKTTGVVTLKPGIPQGRGKRHIQDNAWRIKAAEQFRDACALSRNSESGLQRAVESLDGVLLCIFRGFLRERKIIPGNNNTFYRLATLMRTQLGWHNSTYDFCTEIHEARNQAHHDGISPPPELVGRAVEFVRERIREVGVSADDPVTPSPKPPPEGPTPEPAPASADEIEKALALVDVVLKQTRRRKDTVREKRVLALGSLRELCRASADNIATGGWGPRLMYNGTELVCAIRKLEEAKRGKDSNRDSWDSFMNPFMYGFEWLRFRLEINEKLGKLLAETQRVWTNNPTHAYFSPEPSRLLKQIEEAEAEIGSLEERIRHLEVERESLASKLYNARQRSAK